MLEMQGFILKRLNGVYLLLLLLYMSGYDGYSCLWISLVYTGLVIYTYGGVSIDKIVQTLIIKNQLINYMYAYV